MGAALGALIACLLGVENESWVIKSAASRHVWGHLNCKSSFMPISTETSVGNFPVENIAFFTTWFRPNFGSGRSAAYSNCLINQQYKTVAINRSFDLDFLGKLKCTASFIAGVLLIFLQVTLTK